MQNLHTSESKGERLESEGFYCGKSHVVVCAYTDPFSFLRVLRSQAGFLPAGHASHTTHLAHKARDRGRIVCTYRIKHREPLLHTHSRVLNATAARYLTKPRKARRGRFDRRAPGVRAPPTFRSTAATSPPQPTMRQTNSARGERKSRVVIYAPLTPCHSPASAPPPAKPPAAPHLPSSPQPTIQLSLRYGRAPPSAAWSCWCSRWYADPEAEADASSRTRSLLWLPKYAHLTKPTDSSLQQAVLAPHPPPAGAVQPGGFILFDCESSFD